MKKRQDVSSAVFSLISFLYEKKYLFLQEFKYEIWIDIWFSKLATNL